MSRHFLPDSLGSGYFVVGYDRPLRAFFMQAFNEDGELLFDDTCFDMDEPIIGLEIPDELRDQMISEAVGTADTNMIKDWRKPCEQT